MKTTYLLKQGQIHTLETSRLDNLFKGKSHADTTLFNIFFLPLLVIPHLLKEDLLYQGMAVMWFARTLAMDDYSSVIAPNRLRLSNKRKALGSRKNIPS